MWRPCEGVPFVVPSRATVPGHPPTGPQHIICVEQTSRQTPRWQAIGLGFVQNFVRRNPQVLAQVIGSLNFLCAEFFGNAAVLIEVIRQRSNRLQDVQLPRKLGCKGSSLCRADTAAPGAREERVSRRSVPSEANGKVATTLNFIAQAKAI